MEILVSSIEKLVRRLEKYPKDFTWSELKRVLAHPSPVLKNYQIKQEIEKLQLEGLL